MEERSALGPHRYAVEGDTFRWYPSGEVLPEHADFVFAALGRLAARYGYAIWLVDAVQSIPVGYETRRRYVQLFMAWDKQVPLLIVAYRAPLPARTTSELILRAIKLKHDGEPGDLQADIFPSEVEALRYLGEQRLRLQDQRGAASPPP
ncbi:MAG TPA: hypothetical protein PLW65_07090 [Pseudomonadota bacterium]|nr:hypothetical protein [Pseudomonadota bacterium]